MHELDQRVLDNQYNEYLTAREAAALLGVKLPTLYAYTSRGLIRSVAGPKGRTRRYLRADLERLRARRDARAGHGPVAAGALRFGEPVLDTRITAIDPELGPIYRGRPAAQLAAQGTPFEAVCELLWSGASPGDSAEPVRWPATDTLPNVDSLARLLPETSTPLERWAASLPRVAAHDPGRFASRPESVLPRARRLMRRMAAALVPRLEAARIQDVLAAPSMALAVARALGAPARPEVASALDRALVLCADHELNASAFAARVAASTDADLYACVSAALAALSGPKHGGAADRIEVLIEEIGEPARAEHVVHERARRGETIEGFGSRIYPRGDPRGVALLGWAEVLAPSARSVCSCRALVDAMSASGVGPTIDLGLVALASALELPRGSAVGLFAIARCGGWVAHTLEQYEAGYLLRPRARYTEQN
jgi:citrate synthase